MAEIEKSARWQWKGTETQEKNPLSTKETTRQEK
ncbi:thymosin beta-4, Y-chromosomal-like [Lontra canadensis]|nr:thymosin beta-4, Y-chromosomal-like [Lontra canadensis]